MNRKYLFGIFAILIVIIVVIYYVNQSTNYQILGKPVSQYFYQQLVELSNQGYNVTAAPLTLNYLPLNFSSDNKPAVVYVGAEWCPYCAVERWALIIALLRFGNFSNLEYMLSSPTDVYPNTPTFTFVNSTYDSKYISFVPIEYQNRQHQQLEKIPISVYDMWTTYANSSIPFIIIGYYYEVGTTINPGLLSGKNWTYVITELHNPNSEVYKQIYAQANLITKYICKIDGYKPVSVCSHFQNTSSLNSESLTTIISDKSLFITSFRQKIQPN